MSDTQTTEISDTPLFSVTEVEQLTDDDVTAGRAIGIMLSMLFLYTVVAMTFVILWTRSSIDSETSTAAETEIAAEPAH